MSFEEYKNYLYKAKKIKLSQNFNLHEFLISERAIHSKIDNLIFDPRIVSNIQALCVHVLQPVRDHFKKTVKITSGFRCPELNKAVGGAITSQHVKGQAADIKVKGISDFEVFKFIKENLETDQLILEPSWVHVSFNKNKNRKQIIFVKK